MKLKAYLRANGLTYVEFGRLIGRSHVTVVRLANGQSMPSLRLAHRIEEATNGQVKGSDFLTNNTPTPPSTKVA